MIRFSIRLVIKLGFILILTLSCGSVMKVIAGIPSLKVYTQEEIKQQIDNLPKAQNIYDATIKGSLDESWIKEYTYQAVMQKTYVFDIDKKLLCYYGDNSCSKYELSELSEKSMSDVYESCVLDSVQGLVFEDYKNLQKDIQYVDKSPNNSVKYTVITFWNSDIEKNQIVENWGYFHNYFKNEKDVQFIRIFTDLNEDWGLKKGAKVSFKNRKVKGEKGAYIMTLKDLPYLDKKLVHLSN